MRSRILSVILVFPALANVFGNDITSDSRHVCELVARLRLKSSKAQVVLNLGKRYPMREVYQDAKTALDVTQINDHFFVMLEFAVKGKYSAQIRLPGSLFSAEPPESYSDVLTRVRIGVGKLSPPLTAREGNIWWDQVKKNLSGKGPLPVRNGVSLADLQVNEYVKSLER